MNGDEEFCESIFGMPIPACLVTSIQDRSWMDLANSPSLEGVFVQAPLRPRFYSISGIAAATKWWRDELDEETLQCYLGTSGEYAAPGHMSRMKTLIIGDLGPDLPFALDYRDSLKGPSVAFLGEGDAWREVSENVCDLLVMLGSERPDV
ncbi:hypothetical protein [Streptomyces sp. NPDC001068]|uniref:hypothetical protein n=1 Tax=Streptomyces sp. NPDC001068 TaxID=3364544 RepID=UPI0036A5EB32